ncbi:phage head-tail joining protein [Brevundimonas sp.]|uniref:phage head-tail joining protein n=1 Tax=Brevundimonas sp. TaxID=1871086 RepID=UPI00289DD7D1|nr:hypothetical protein [Brevundimonas sp.]
MADHSARIDALEDALASGELTIKVEGKETTYRDTKSLITALSYFRARHTEGAGASSSGGFGSTLATFGAD